MAFVVKDRVKETTTTTGTSDLVLSGSVSGFQSFSNALADGDTTYYALFEVSTNEWEVGVGTWTESTTTLARTTVLASSNSGSKVSLTAQAEVFISQPAGKAAFFDPSGDLTLVQDPTSNLQAATKQYVDTIAAAGLHYHDPVRVEQEGNLSATYSNGTAGVGATLTNNSTQAALTIDGVALSLNDRVLIYEQTNGYENGVYTVTNVGSASTNWVLTRATDADSYAPSDPDSLGQGDAFFVLEGTAGAGELYVMNTEGSITFGTTNITFTQVAATAVYSAGTGLTLTGTEFAAAQDISTTASPSFAGVTLGDGHTIGDDVGDNLTLTSSTGENIIYNSAAGTHAFKSNGTSTVTFDGAGNITVTGTVDGRDIAADGSKLDGIESGATADQTKSDIDALGINAATLDSLDSTQFLRSDANDTATGELTFNSKLDIANGTYLGWGGGTSRPAITGNKTSNVMLFYAGGSEKLRINTTGIDVTGTVEADKVNIGNGNQTSFNVEYANDGSGIGPILRTFRDSASPAVGDALGGLDFKGNNSAGSEKFYARIKGVIIDPADTTEDGAVEISVSKAGTAAWETSALVAKFDPNGMELRGEIIFEGSAANNSETTLTVTDPTADRTITRPDATGTVWTSGNDGSGSGLDADTVDGVQGSSFLRSDADDTATGKIVFGSPISAGSSAKLQVGGFQRTGPIMLAVGTTSASSFNTTNERWLLNDGSHLYASTSSTGYNNKIWTDGNDGSGSGLDADTVDGIQASSFLRSDADDSASGDITFTESIQIQSGGGSGNPIRIGSGFGSGGSATIHKYGAALYLQYANGQTSTDVLLGGGGTTANLRMQGGYIDNISSAYVQDYIYHQGDTDTYIGFGTNTITLATGGSSEITVTSTGVQLGDTGNGYFQPVSGNYGSIQIDGGSHGGYEGYNIGGRAAFLHNNATESGISDDVNNLWMVRLVHGGAAELMYSGSKKIETTSTGVNVTGALTATTKSFVIDHPTKEGMKLRHGSLEGPEDGVYVRGRLTGETVIELPDYWTGLVHEDSITVQLTAMGGKADLWVESIADNKVTVGCDTEVDCFYFVQATRKDVDAWDIEYVADS